MKKFFFKNGKEHKSFKRNINIKNGRANINMLDTIKVDVYGQLMPIEQLGTVSVPEADLYQFRFGIKAI